MCEPTCESRSDSAPEPFQKRATETGQPVCRCGAGPHSTLPHRCAKGHGLPRNSLTLKHGAYASRELLAIDHAPQLESAESFLVGTITDHGGLSEVSTIERGYAGKLAELELAWSLLALDVRRRGILTPSGRPSGAYVLLLQTLDRWDRLAQRLGMGRRAKACAMSRDVELTPEQQSILDDAVKGRLERDRRKHARELRALEARLTEARVELAALRLALEQAQASRLGAWRRLWFHKPESGTHTKG